MNAIGHHRQVQGWVHLGARRGRWIEPFVLPLVAENPVHGYSVGREVLHEWAAVMAERRRIIKSFLDRVDRIKEDIEDLSPRRGGPSGG